MRMIVSKFSIAYDETKSLFLFLKLLLKDGWPCRCMCAGSMLRRKRSNPTQLQAAPQLCASSDFCFGSPPILVNFCRADQKVTDLGLFWSIEFVYGQVATKHKWWRKQAKHPNIWYQICFILKPFEQNIPEHWKWRSFTQLQMKFEVLMVNICTGALMDEYSLQALQVIKLRGCDLLSGTIPSISLTSSEYIKAALQSSMFQINTACKATS